MVNIEFMIAQYGLEPSNHQIVIVSLAPNGQVKDYSHKKVIQVTELYTIEKKEYCPFCNEIITLIIDLSAEDQNYREDCEVCCQPMQINCIIGIDNSVALEIICAQ